VMSSVKRGGNSSNRPPHSDSHVSAADAASSRCPIIGSPLPEKSPPADNLPAKIRLARTAAGRLFYGAGDILMRERQINSVIICPRAVFSWGVIFM